MKAIAVIGYHHTGKTTTVVALVKALSAKGYKVATIKDIHSEKFRADTAGKNSALHVDAGSIQSIARGLHDSAVIYPRQLTLQEMLSRIEADFLIIEGMKDAPVPKIVCAADPNELKELVDDSSIAISGIIADSDYQDSSLPIFSSIRDADKLCSYVIERSFEVLPAADPECCSRCGSNCYDMCCEIVQGRKSRTDCVLDGHKRISLKVAGKELLIVPFVQDILKDTIMAVISNLRDVEAGKDIEIRIHNEGE